MPGFTVELSPEAVDHVERIQAWWLIHRQRAPKRFLQELQAALGQLQRSPHLGKLYEANGVWPMRRILLFKTSYHVYYWPDEGAQIVRVYAVWHAGRGEPPALG